MTLIKADTFFNDLFNDEPVNFNAIGQYPKTLSGFYPEKYDTLRQLNQLNHNIYFVVNSGGYKDKEINRINAVFIDLDCGKDENGKYFDIDTVEAFKENKLEWK